MLLLVSLSVWIGHQVPSGFWKKTFKNVRLESVFSGSKITWNIDPMWKNFSTTAPWKGRTRWRKTPCLQIGFCVNRHFYSSYYSLLVLLLLILRLIRARHIHPLCLGTLLVWLWREKGYLIRAYYTLHRKVHVEHFHTQIFITNTPY